MNHDQQQVGSQCAASDSNVPEWSIELLTEQHQRIDKLLVLIEKQVTLLREGDDPNYNLLQDIFYYLAHFIDSFHHPKEELLFSKIAERNLVAYTHVENLRELHRLIAKKGARFLANVNAVLGGSVVPRQVVADPAEEYVANFRKHMALETQSLFPLARAYLGHADWAAIKAAIGHKEDPAFDQPGQGNYRALYHRIAYAVDCDCIS